MINWIIVGLLLMDEKRYYSGLELLSFLGSSLLCLIGIKFLAVKTKANRDQRKSIEAEVKKDVEQE